MTATLAWLAGAATVAIGLLLLAAHALRRRRAGARIEAPGEAMDAAAHLLSGFRPLAAAVGQDGAAALVSGEGDRLAVLRAGTRRHRAREIAWQAVRATADGIVVETDARPFAHVSLRGVDALDMRRLAPPPRQRQAA